MASESIADIVAKMRRGFDQSWHDIDREWVHSLPDRIEAAAKRAYNDIDKSVCGIEDASNYDIDGVRMAMDKTIGDYYE